MDDKNANPSTNTQETKEEINKSLGTTKVEESKDIKSQPSINNSSTPKPVEQKQIKEETQPSQPKQNKEFQSVNISNKTTFTQPEKKENQKFEIHLGDRVRINPRCTKTATGVAIPSFAYSNVYTVKKIYSNRILIKINTLQYAVTINDVIKLK